MHQQDLYPERKAASTRDIGLPAGTGDAKYLKILEEELTAFLAETRRVLALDLLGYGLSDKPWPHDYSIAEQTDLLEAWLARLSLESLERLLTDAVRARLFDPKTGEGAPFGPAFDAAEVGRCLARFPPEGPWALAVEEELRPIKGLRSNTRGAIMDPPSMKGGVSAVCTSPPQVRLPTSCPMRR